MAKLNFGVSPASVVLRVKLMDSSVSTGAGLTGLTSASSGLIISTIKIGDASATAYTVAGSTIETIATLGTFAAPTATKCRFKEVDATNHPGIYELQFDDARFASTGSLLISVSGATNLAQADIEVQCSNLATNVIQAGGVAWASGAITDSVFAANTYPKAIRTNSTNGAAAGYVDLDGSASSTDNYYVGCSIKITSGTGAGQSRTIIYYVGSTKRAYVDRVWATNPTSATYLINAGKLTVDVLAAGVAAAGGASSITLDANAVATAEYYDGAIVQIVSGTGIGQSRVITGYTAARVATVADAWAVQPTSSSVYIVRGLGDVEVGVNNDKTGYALASTAVNVTAIDGQATNGYNATLKLKQLDISNNAGDAIKATSTLNGCGLNLTGDGSGTGIKASGGATGHGVEVWGGITSGDALSLNSTKGSAINADGALNGAVLTGHDGEGLLATGGLTGAGIKAIGGDTGTGLKVEGGASGGDGIYAKGGNAGGIGLLARGMIGSAGISSIGGVSGPGMVISAEGNTALKIDAYNTEVAANYDGVKVYVGTGDGNGVNIVGSGTGSGMLLTKGGSGTGDLKFGTPECTIPVATSVTNRVTANSDEIAGVAAAATQLSKSASVIISGTIDNTGFAPTTTEFECSDITSAGTDYYKGRTVILTSGALIGQARRIVGYTLTGGRGHFTVDALTAAPANGVTIVIV
jgi:hypothetical protein